MDPVLAKQVRDKVDIAKAALKYPMWVFASLAGTKQTKEEYKYFSLVFLSGILTLMLVVGALIVVLRSPEKIENCVISERSPLIQDCN